MLPALDVHAHAAGSSNPTGGETIAVVEPGPFEGTGLGILKFVSVAGHGGSAP